MDALPRPCSRLVTTVDTAEDSADSSSGGKIKEKQCGGLFKHPRHETDSRHGDKLQRDVTPTHIQNEQQGASLDTAIGGRPCMCQVAMARAIAQDWSITETANQSAQRGHTHSAMH